MSGDIPTHRWALFFPSQFYFISQGPSTDTHNHCPITPLRPGVYPLRVNGSEEENTLGEETRPFRKGILGAQVPTARSRKGHKLWGVTAPWTCNSLSYGQGRIWRRARVGPFRAVLLKVCSIDRSVDTTWEPATKAVCQASPSTYSTKISKQLLNTFNFKQGWLAQGLLLSKLKGDATLRDHQFLEYTT